MPIQKSCCVRDCVNSFSVRGQKSEANDGSISFFAVPKNKELFERWSDTFSYILEKDFVCERHFLREHIVLYSNGRTKKLRKNSCPAQQSEENRNLMYHQKGDATIHKFEAQNYFKKKTKRIYETISCEDQSNTKCCH